MDPWLIAVIAYLVIGLITSIAFGKLAARWHRDSDVRRVR